jgi:hypothetical protein
MRNDRSRLWDLQSTTEHQCDTTAPLKESYLVLGCSDSGSMLLSIHEKNSSEKRVGSDEPYCGPDDAESLPVVPL